MLMMNLLALIMVTRITLAISPS